MKRARDRQRRHPAGMPRRMVSAAARRRRGVSLVEILIVVTIAGVILLVSMTTIHLLLRAEREQARAVWMAVTVSRLEQVFREDVHASLAEPLVPQAEALPRLTLAADDGRAIAYIADDHVLERVESRSGAESHRDQFHFPPGTRIRFESDESPRLVRLVLDVAAAESDRMPQRGADRPGPPPRSLTIEALARRDSRFSGRSP